MNVYNGLIKMSDMRGPRCFPTLDAIYEWTDTPSIIDDHFLTFNTGSRRFDLFDSIDHYVEWSDSAQPHERHWDETILKDQPQKMRIDIDGAPTTYLLSPCKMYNTIIDTIISTLQSVLYQHFKICISKYSCIVADASKDTKISYHIILDKYYFVNNQHCKRIAEMVHALLPDDIKPLMDMSVYKTTQNFRMVGSSKPAEPTRLLRIISKDISDEAHTFWSSLITNVTDCELVWVDGVDESASPESAPSGNLMESAIARLKAEYPEHSFREFKKGVLVFDRIRPSLCEFCKRHHETDNTLMAWIDTVRGYSSDINGTIVVMCRKDSQKKKKKLGIGMDPAKWRPTIPHLTVELEKLSNTVIYSEPTIRSFTHDFDVLYVKAQMKMGKTKTVKEYVANNHSNSSAIILTHRQTFAEEIASHFPTFNLYSRVKGPLTHENTIVQIESLQRLNVTKPYDLLILDESESLFDQFDSGLLKDFKSAWQTFIWLVKYTARIICLDAHISDRSLRVIERIRYQENGPYIPEKCLPSIFHWNQWAQASADKYSFTRDEDKWLDALKSAIESGSNVGIPMSSKRDADSVYQLIQSTYPTISSIIYSSDTSSASRKEHFGNVNEWWKKYQIVIYTPTVGAGISFEEQHFDEIFGYFIDCSCTVEACVQMLGRIRNVGRRKYTIFIGAEDKYKPVTREELEYRLRMERTALFTDTVTVGNLDFTLSMNGVPQYTKSPYYELWIQNTIVRNRSRSRFYSHFIGTIMATGAQVDVGDPSAINQSDELKDVKLELRQQEAELVASSDEITAEDYDRIRLDQDPSKEDKAAAKKYWLRKFYGWNTDIDPEWVIGADKSTTKHAFKQCLDTLKEDTVDESLKTLRIKQREHYKFLDSMPDIAYKEVLLDRSYERQHFANNGLKYIGYRDIWDKTRVPFDTFMTKASEYVKMNQEKFTVLLDIDSITLRDPWLTIKTMLKTQYGFDIRTTKSKENIARKEVKLTPNKFVVSLLEGTVLLKATKKI